MADRIAGTCYVRIDGGTLTLAASLSVMPSRVERTDSTGLDGRVDYVEMPIAPYIEGDFKATPGRSVTGLDQVTDATIVVELANGRTFTLEGAFWTGNAEISAQDGTFTGRFTGSEVSEYA